MDHKKYITEKGTIHYWVNICTPEKKWIVFLPGLTADHSLFDSQVECFLKKYNMFVWDAPAHGLSRPFELSFSMQDIVHYLYTIFQIEHIVMPIFVGQSLGGYIAQVYITEYPNTTLGFISVDSCPMSRRYYSWWELALMRHTKGMYMSIPWKLLLKWGINGTSETSYGRQVMKNAWSVYTKEEYCSLADYGYRILVEAITARETYSITCPVLLLCGERDHAGSAKRYNRNWAKFEEYKLCWITDAGHNSNTDSPEQVNNLIELFVGELSSEI